MAVLRTALAAVLLVAGVAHFVYPAPFEALVPPPIPAWPAVALSGAAEIACGLGLLVAATRRAAGLATIGLFAAVFPANIYHAVQAGLVGSALPEPLQNQAVAIARLPFQLALVMWAWKVTPKRQNGRREGDRPET